MSIKNFLDNVENLSKYFLNISLVPGIILVFIIFFYSDVTLGLLQRNGVQPFASYSCSMASSRNTGNSAGNLNLKKTKTEKQKPLL